MLVTVRFFIQQAVNFNIPLKSHVNMMMKGLKLVALFVVVQQLQLLSLLMQIHVVEF